MSQMNRFGPPHAAAARSFPAVLWSRGWLSEQPEALRSEVARLARVTHVDAGERLYAVGDPPEGIYGIGEGQISIDVADGSERVPVHVASPPAWIGEAGALPRGPRLVGARALTAAVLVHLPQRELEALLAEHPRWWPCFSQLHAQSLALALRFLRDQIATSTRERVARRLVEHVEPGGGGAAEIALTQMQVADLLGLSRASLARALASLSAAGLVDRGYGRIRVLDVEGLRRVAVGEPLAPVSLRASGKKPAQQ